MEGERVRLAEKSASPSALVRHNGSMTPEDTPNPNRVLLDELHQLRGAFLSQVANVESSLDLLIRLYFDVPTNRRYEFTAWVLSAVSFSNKVELLGRITRAGQPGSTMRGIVSSLKEIINWRNEVAHAAIDVDIGPGETIEEAMDNWRWASIRWTRSGVRSEVRNAALL
jgi:hypothetical protein